MTYEEIARQKSLDMRIVEIGTVSDFLAQVMPLSLGPEGIDYVFRGQQCSDWRIQSTFSRFSTVRFPDHHPIAITQLIDRFIHGMAQVGQYDERMSDPRARLELARHYGVPSPLIDVTRSPFVALWFAFNGVRGTEGQGNVAVYAINWNMASVAYHRYLHSVNRDTTIEALYGRPVIDVFRWENRNFFDNGFPQGEVKFIPLAASWNVKMQRQQGAFFYDLLNYAGGQYQSLEEMIDAHDPHRDEENAVITKFIIPQSTAGAFFGLLDVAGVNGAMIYNDHTGVVADVFNTFNYNPRAANWDLNIRNNPREE